MRILITGANGFLGSHIVEQSLAKGHETVALLRKGADIENLEHLSGYEKCEIDYSSTESILKSLETLPDFDLFIHNAGLTKSYTLDKYIQVNVQLTERLIDAIKKSGKLKENGKFVYISSLAAKGPVGNGGPASNYGRSKVLAENTLINSGLNYLIYRPAGIYGARDVQFVPLIKIARIGLYPLMTSAQHKMALINARDAAENIIECSIAHQNEIIHLEDGNVYLHADMQRIFGECLNKKTSQFKVGKPIIKSILYVSDIIDRSFKRTPKLSLEHYLEISQDWDYDFSEERKRIPLTINYPLKAGFQDAINYYQEKGLI